jgi:hypothetical protein
LDLKYWTSVGINKQGLQIYRFKVILGRKIQIRREKIFLTTPWSSTGLLVKNIDMTNPVLAQGEVQFFFLDGFEFYDQKLP